MRFKTIVTPNGNKHFMPTDLNLVFPDSNLSQDKLHFLAYISWDNKYLKKIPPDFKDFFKVVLPHLHARTTGVHTACVMPFLDELIKDQKVNRRVVAIALILHDAGWSRLSEAEIANSLGYKGLKLSQDAVGPKQKHAIESVNIAKQILKDFTFSPPLNQEEIKLILDAIRYHDRPEEVTRSGHVPSEVKLVADLDHLWSFTYENFWQDTVRKGVMPSDYLDNLNKDLDSYFITQQGKIKAKELLKQRRKEVNQLLSLEKEI